MKGKKRNFEFSKVCVCVEEVKEINNDKPPEPDNLDGKLLRIIADDIATRICHIFNLSQLESVWPSGLEGIKSQSNT